MKSFCEHIKPNLYWIVRRETSRPPALGLYVPEKSPLFYFGPFKFDNLAKGWRLKTHHSVKDFTEYGTFTWMLDFCIKDELDGYCWHRERGDMVYPYNDAPNLGYVYEFVKDLYAAPFINKNFFKG